MLNRYLLNNLITFFNITDIGNQCLIINNVISILIIIFYPSWILNYIKINKINMLIKTPFKKCIGNKICVVTVYCYYSFCYLPSLSELISDKYKNMWIVFYGYSIIYSHGSQTFFSSLHRVIWFTPGFYYDF